LPAGENAIEVESDRDKINIDRFIIIIQKLLHPHEARKEKLSEVRAIL